jgi:hypothetical protein
MVLKLMNSQFFFQAGKLQSFTYFSLINFLFLTVQVQYKILSFLNLRSTYYYDFCPVSRSHCLSFSSFIYLFSLYPVSLFFQHCRTALELVLDEERLFLRHGTTQLAPKHFQCSLWEIERRRPR